MSSALKPVLTPSGAQNPPVPSQLNKPMHSQGPPTTYGQPMSHIPQNLVNIPHNAPSSTNVHNPAHSNTHSVPHHLNTNAHVTGHSANHYSLNVPNASQHYPMGGNTPAHSAPVSNHPVANTSQSHAPPVSTFSSPPKNLSYNPNYQANLGHSYKMPSVVPTTQSLPASQPPAAAEEPPAEKPQSNGTPEVKVASKPEPPQNHVATPGFKDKPPPPAPTPPSSQTSTPPAPEKPKTTPEKPATTTPPVEQKANVDVNKPSEVISTPAPSDKTSASTGPGTAVSAASSVSPASSTNVPSVAVSTPPSTTAATSTTEAATVATTTTTPSATVAPVQTIQPAVSTSSPENQEPQDSVVTVTATASAAATTTNTTNTNKPKEQSNQKPTLKLATTPRTPTRKAKTPKPEADSSKSPKSDTKSPTQKSPSSGGKIKRNRIRTQPYQSPLPEVEMISKISATTPRNKNSEDKLIIFYKNEFLAVRNSEGGFYICQAVQNIYKSSPRIRIRWLSQDKNDKEIYTPDFYDYTDFDCILTNLNLGRVGKGKYKLPANEKVRTDSILKRALAVEKGDATPPSLTEEHPDGLDLSLYKEESQLKKRKAVKRKASTPLKASVKPTNIKKSPDQPKVRKVVSKPKPPPVKKAIVIKRALSAKVKKSATGRAERAAKRQQEAPKSSTKTSPVIDQKKAKVLAKVARKTAIPLPTPKIQPPPPKQNAKAVKPAASSSSSFSSKKQPPAVLKKQQQLAVIRKSKRGKK